MKFFRTLIALCLLAPTAYAAPTSHPARSAGKRIVYECDSLCHERRIPAILCVGQGEHAGRLITFYDNRINGADIGAGKGSNISIQLSVSDDNGLSWSEPRCAVGKAGNEVTAFNPSLLKDSVVWKELRANPAAAWNAAFGDAAVVSDADSPELLLLAAAGPTLFFRGTREKPMQCVGWRSADGGDSWSAPVILTDSILPLFDGEPRHGHIDSFFFASGKIAQSRKIKTGDYARIYAAISSHNSGDDIRNWVLFSDDFGRSWNVLGGLDKSPVDLNLGDEAKVEELPDGSVLLAGRGHNGGRTFNIFTYSDIVSGSGQWDDFVVSNLGREGINACNGEILIFEAKDAATLKKSILALQSFTDSPRRENVSIAWKCLPDRKLTPSDFLEFDGVYRVTDNPSAYSTMCRQADGRIGFFLEEIINGGEYDGVFIPLDIEEITSGKFIN